MILSAHAVGGAAVGVLLKAHPILAFFVGFASHFVLDSIPHWQYDVRSFEKNPSNPANLRFAWNSKKFARDLFFTGIDCVSGFAIVILMGWGHSNAALTAALLGAIGGVLPDLLQLVHYIMPHSPIRHLHRFHHWIHSRYQLGNIPAVGIPALMFFVALFTAALWRAGALPVLF